MKYGTVIVLFNPDESAIHHINELVQRNVNLVLVDNSAIPNKFYSSSTFYFFNGNKGGIAGALNLGVDYLFANGCDFVFTFDQDSKIPSDFYSSMDCLIKRKNANLVCPNFFDINSKTYATFVHLTKFSYEIIEQADYTNLAISSGMGISQKAWKNIGVFNDEYIIDHVDTDYCLRALDKDYKIYVNYDVCLNHAIGNRTTHKFLGVTVKPNHHNFIRKYYIARNGTHLAFKYFFKYPSYFYLNVLRVVHELICVLFYEEGKIKKTASILKGILHSIFGKLGSYV